MLRDSVVSTVPGIPEKAITDYLTDPAKPGACKMTSACLKDLDVILSGDEFIIPTNKEIGAEVSDDIGQRVHYLYCHRLPSY